MAPTPSPVGSRWHPDRWRRGAEHLAIPLAAALAAFALFSIFLLLRGRSPIEFAQLIWKGGFGTPFSLRNTLQRTPPLIFCALAVAIPARLGLTLIGGEGAFVLSGFAAAAVAIPFADGRAPALLVVSLMVAASSLTGALWLGIAGLARHMRQINETISSLLLSYIAIALMNFFVEGALRDPGQPGKSSTLPVAPAYLVGDMPGIGVHWGLAAALLLALVLFVLMFRTTFGFAARMTGGNVRAAQAQGLPVGRLIVASTMVAGACAGLGGYFEVAAVQGRANASLAAGYGFAGILVSFMARHHPLAVVPVAVLFAGFAASGGLVQRRMDLPDAVILLLQSLIFVVLLLSETMYGRLRLFQPRIAGVHP
jgi:ABC-type uncharacterized transport system permease subunit